MWESASAHMDGRQRDRGDVVLFCADLCLCAGFAISAEDAHHSLEWRIITAESLLLCNAGMSLNCRFLSRYYASGFEQVPRGVMEWENGLQLQGQTSHFLWLQTSSQREEAAKNNCVQTNKITN